MNTVLLLALALVASALWASVLMQRATLREIQSLRTAVLRPSGRLAEAIETPAPEDRLHPSRRPPEPLPQPAPRLVSPTRAKQTLERRLAERAKAAEDLRRASPVTT